MDAGDEDVGEDIRPLLELLASHDVRMTVPVTSSILQDHARAVSMFLDDGHEVAGHGDVHTPFRESLEIQVRRLETMIAEFEKHLGVRPLGFRAPFLDHSRQTYSALAEVHLRYDSSRTCTDPWIRTMSKVRGSFAYPLRWRDIPRIWGRYLLGRGLPTGFFVAPGVLELPVFDLDDWFFLDAPQGPRLSPDRSRVIAEHWLAALERFSQRDDGMLVVQAHPRRVHRGLLIALDAFVTAAKERNCNFITLAEMTNWFTTDERWRRRNRGVPQWL